MNWNNVFCLKNSNKYHHDKLSELCDMFTMFKLMSKAQLGESIRKRRSPERIKLHNDKNITD
eukprot:TRINITY_DN3262_c0_g1_i4.p1 TRINITY_DN3262_c0_g1~~TRINITY_DN3262_c0_g1_i4.p1  ORF type:complete len:62 (+),score=12.40 TRINITY_DN3262_c0_g1_i4:182-367(+)